MEGTGRRVPALTAALSKRRAALETLLAGGAGAPTGERLHAVRVALRRTVSLARLTQDVPAKGSGAGLKTAARDLRRALGVRRTHDVAATLLRLRFRRDARRRPSAERLAERLERDARAAAPAGRLDALLGAVRREFAARDAALAALRSPLADLDGGRLERRLEKDIRRRLVRRARAFSPAESPRKGTCTRRGSTRATCATASSSPGSPGRSGSCRFSRGSRRRRGAPTTAPS